LFTIRALLHLRRARPRLFDKGAYEVLPARGAHAEHVIAVARRHSRSLVVALAPRLTLGIAGPGRFPIGQRVWDDTTVILPDDVRPRLTDQLTGITFESPRGRLRVSDALGLLPVSVLTELHD
jgi:(1->4)-alpha-D-glucan 1-alpha-D-glucosylmutase